MDLLTPIDCAGGKQYFFLDSRLSEENMEAGLTKQILCSLYVCMVKSVRVTYCLVAFPLDLSYYAFKFQLIFSIYRRNYDLQSLKWTRHSILCDDHYSMQECLATADFSNSVFSQLVSCSLRRNERFRPVSPICSKPHSHRMRYTQGF